MKMKKKYKIIKDRKYGYYKLQPTPTQKEVDKYYTQEFYSNKNKFNDSSLILQRDEQEYMDSRWEAIYNVCKKHFGEVKGLSLFDIGFGFAQAMLFLKQKGFIVSGLEPCIDGVEYAKSQGLKVYHAGVEDFSCVKTEKLDVVMLINVLEHLRDPVKILLEIKNKLLKENGLLVIDVPNDFNDFQIVANKEHKLNEWWVCPPNHINYFSFTSLSNLLDKCGYDIIVKEASFPMDLFLLMGDVYVGDSKLGKKCHQKRVMFENLMRKNGKADKLTEFYRSLAKLNLGRQAIMYATPRRN
jgi:2-polyprenyl-3-methyl-5-hydroxy-6-metoxy-1,4-benzoquinol methylase